MKNATKLLLGTRKGLFILEPSGNSWFLSSTHHLGIPIAYAFSDVLTKTLWVCQDHGHWGQKLARSNDDGKNWEKIPEPQYPPDAEIKPGEAASLRYLWYMTAGGKDEPETLYLGTEPGGLFISRNNGESFELVEGLWNHPSRQDQWQGGGRDKPGIHSILIDPRNSRHLYVGISVAGVFESKDSGNTWEPRNKGIKASFMPDPEIEVGHDPHFVSWSPQHPETLWQQNHCGIFISHDGARTWQDVSEIEGPAHFGFPIAVAEEDSNTAWVVPATSDEQRHAHGGQLKVCRTEDAGQSWQPFTQGLPTKSWDLVLRHALDISGETLAFGTTTGNVYLSSNCGESWQCLGNNFPPIYSVRFC